MLSSSTLTIDLDAIESNISAFKKKGEIMAMVKANGYGTGVIDIVPYLSDFGVKILGVSHVNEGILLRKAGIKMPIFVLSAPAFEAKQVVEYCLEPAISSIEEATALNHAAKKLIPIHLHIDTGMNRFGVNPEKAIQLVKAIRRLSHLYIKGIMTHFTSADLPEMDSYTNQQIAIFKEVVDFFDPLPHWIHAANGAGAQRFSIPFCNLVRIGLALFESALTLKSHLSFIKKAQKGESVGYHSGYIFKQDSLIGTIPFGYYDGLHCDYKEKGYVLVREKQSPMIGRICMDFMMIDLTKIPEAKIGDPVILFDPKSLPLKVVAGWTNTNVREVLVRIGARTQRSYIRRGCKVN
ncbi:MAG: alanine racemase [Chlamydiales bacterium]